MTTPSKKNLPATKTEVAKVETTAVVPEVKSGAVLPSLAGASPAVIERMNEVKDNFESVDSFRLPRAKMTAEGFELIDGEEPITQLEGVIIHTKKTNVFYANPYNPNDITLPDCFSLDGVTPDKTVEKPQHATCKGCPKAEFGTNAMKSGKACRNLKPLYMLLADEAIMPRQVTVTPASLKAANQYIMDLTERGIAYRKVKTKIEAYKKNPKDTYMSLKFTMGKRLDEQEIANVNFLKNQWLPIMNAQNIDQNEFAAATPEQQPASSNEY